MPFIEKFSHGACISEWRFFPIKSIQFNSRIYKSNRLQQFHFIKCAQIQVSVRETKWPRAAPGCVTSEAEHKWCLQAAWGPVIGRYRGCADISVWSPSSLWPASGSVITTTSRQGAIFLWISWEINEKNIGFHSGQQWFFCSQLFLHFAKCMKYEVFDRGHR